MGARIPMEMNVAMSIAAAAAYTATGGNEAFGKLGVVKPDETKVCAKGSKAGRGWKASTDEVHSN